MKNKKAYFKIAACAAIIGASGYLLCATPVGSSISKELSSAHAQVSSLPGVSGSSEKKTASAKKHKKHKTVVIHSGTAKGGTTRNYAQAAKNKAAQYAAADDAKVSSKNAEDSAKSQATKDSYQQSYQDSVNQVSSNNTSAQ